MSSNFEKFKALHHGADLFVLPNAWDAKSALLFQEKVFPAVATSSGAVAACLGYEDGEKMPLEDYLFVIKRILAGVKRASMGPFFLNKTYTKATELLEELEEKQSFAPLL